ncbi:hypothetical protein HanRHA438_Chr00c27g0854241 [Helianthus annuus]|nr:hypothetical protein HanRHA438_Chr00c27g0854241 [Helianthus annuus]
MKRIQTGSCQEFGERGQWFGCFRENYKVGALSFAAGGSTGRDIWDK